jgi:hypothetical protein
MTIMVLYPRFSVAMAINSINNLPIMLFDINILQGVPFFVCVFSLNSDPSVALAVIKLAIPYVSVAFAEGIAVVPMQGSCLD